MITLENLLTAGFGLVTASPLQRAICRAADGLPLADVLPVGDVSACFGCTEETIPVGAAPSLVVLVAGVRGGKTLLAVAAALKSALTADLSSLRPYEVPRVAIVAPTVDNATAAFSMLTGALQSSPMLRQLVVPGRARDEDDSLGAGPVIIQRPDGRRVEIVVVAAHRGGVTLRSRWLAGFVLDEVALFGTETTGAAVNAEELLRAAEGRLLPGGQGWVISSPFGPSGLLHSLYKTHFGHPSSSVVVVHAPTRALNPAYPAEKIEALRAREPDTAAREFDAEWVDADAALFDGALIDGARRDGPEILPHVSGALYAAAIDPATRSNGWTLVVMRVDYRDERAWFRVALAREWRGSKSKPLDPEQVLGEIAIDLDRYGIRRVGTDRWASDALAALARQRGIELLEDGEFDRPAEKYASYGTVRALLQTGDLELAPSALLVSDLKSVRRRGSANGVTIVLPKTSDGRHADFAPALVLAMRSIAHRSYREKQRPLRVEDIVGGRRETFGMQAWGGSASINHAERARNPAVYDAVHGTSGSDRDKWGDW